MSNTASRLHFVGPKTLTSPRALEILTKQTHADAIVFLDDALNTLCSLALSKHTLLKKENLYVLQPHAEARGLVPLLPSVAKQITYTELVNLTEQHPKIESWG